MTQPGTVTVPRGGIVIAARAPVALCGAEWAESRWQTHECTRDTEHRDHHRCGACTRLWRNQKEAS